MAMHCLARAPPHQPSSFRASRARHDDAFSSGQARPDGPPRNPLDPISYQRLEGQYRAYHVRRMYLAGAGMMTCVAITIGIVMVVDIEQITAQRKRTAEQAETRPDSVLHRVEPGTAVVVGPRPTTTTTTAASGAAHPPNDANVQMVPTGSGAVPRFPRRIQLPDDDDDDDDDDTAGAVEYQLLGVGVRTVSFLQIKVYVVGLYVATEDVDRLRQALLWHLDHPVDPTLPAGYETVQVRLLLPQASEELWSAVLRPATGQAGIRTALRIVPTRTTDFGHLRDGWVRAIMARSKDDDDDDDDDDDGFGPALAAFKALFSGSAGARSSVPKGQTLLLMRGRTGVLNVFVGGAGEGGAGAGLNRLGAPITHERISRLVWLNYLAGGRVASESARREVVESLARLVACPVGWWAGRERGR
ncbi:MAG: Altered inheritance of mitochondria protein 18 mitochondrial [Phylliscum demangeonii]|nr:MAG: Altered inheritance of mitochondria protein 18 mitochondrial [Phylliscum demangeonii]